LTECSIAVVVELPEPARESDGAAPRRSAQTEADKVRRQQQVRRKTKLARHALVANRTR
jgi:hypothetical protein